MSLHGVLLALLRNEPDSGYGLSRRLRRDLSHVWEARLQQIYVELGKLESEGLVNVRRVRQHNRPAKKVYSLTEAGGRALDEWLASKAAPVAHRDERLARLSCLDRLPPDVLIEHLSAWLEGWRNDIAALERRLALVSRTDPGELGTRVALEAALARARCDVTWCERVLTVVDRVQQAEEQTEPSTPGLTA